MEQDLTETTIESAVHYEGTILRLRKDQVRMPNGRLTVREVVEHSDSVCMVPIDNEGNVLLVRQYRKPTESALLEVPAGGIEEGESPEEAAMRELQEEVSHVADTLQPLAGFWLAPGWCDEYMYVFLATDLRPSDMEQDYDEMVETRRVPLFETLELIERGEIQDAKSIASLLQAMRVVGAAGSVDN
ncbi:MAG: NUDIX hydrolase [Chloroflexi bacterium]|nr:NUDIX hydrolase [Chloroflexota bacterium]